MIKNKRDLLAPVALNFNQQCLRILRCTATALASSTGGCASSRIRGQAAASIWRQVKQTHLAPIGHHVTPRLALPIDKLDDSLDIEPPALIRGYLRLGAKVLGAPAWDPDSNSADLPMMMRIADLPPRYLKHFTAQPTATPAAV
jgi:putative hemolysin